jgi:hypothetical protein
MSIHIENLFFAYGEKQILYNAPHCQDNFSAFLS